MAWTTNYNYITLWDIITHPHPNFSAGPAKSLLWRHNGRDGVLNHQPHDCLLSRSFKPRSKKTSKLRVTGLCAGNSPATGEFPAQKASHSENVSIWWRHHVPVEVWAWMSAYRSQKAMDVVTYPCLNSIQNMLVIEVPWWVLHMCMSWMVWLTS